MTDVCSLRRASLERYDLFYIVFYFDDRAQHANAVLKIIKM